MGPTAPAGPAGPAAPTAPAWPTGRARAAWPVPAAMVLALAGYALLSHWLMLNAADAPWAVAVLFGPLVLAVAGNAWRARQWPLLAACAGGVLLLALAVQRGGAGSIERMYVLQHAGIHAALALTFAASLRRGGTPLVAVLAAGVHARLHQTFTPAMAAYARRVTVLWAGYFAAMVAVSVLLYLAAPWPWWSAFGNLVTPLSAAALMVGEHVARYRLHPEFERVTLRAALAAYSRHGK